MFLMMIPAKNRFLSYQFEKFVDMLLQYLMIAMIVSFFTTGKSEYSIMIYMIMVHSEKSILLVFVEMLRSRNIYIRLGGCMSFVDVLAAMTTTLGVSSSDIMLEHLCYRRFSDSASLIAW